MALEDGSSAFYARFQTPDTILGLLLRVDVFASVGSAVEINAKSKARGVKPSMANLQKVAPHERKFS